MASFQTKRLAGDLRLLTKSAGNGIEFDFINDDTRPTDFSVVIYGPKDSCFEDCILFFKINLSDNYPIKPPVFTFMTPIYKRFHPNLYADGKVCLTILNTWHDSTVSGWTSATTLEAVLTTIRSMLDDNPLAQEPSQNYKLTDKKAMDYHIAAKYYALQNTFSYFLNDNVIPKDLKDKTDIYFLKNIESYKKTIDLLKKYENMTINYFHGNICIDTNVLETLLDKVIKILVK